MNSESEFENNKSATDQQVTQDVGQESVSSATTVVDAADGAIFSNRRIAKNTILLYMRMILMMGIGLFTSRVILQTLGVNDYGLYNAVGGVLGMFSIVTNSMASSISRYLTYELGRGDKEHLRVVFSTSIIIQFAIAAFVVIVAGTAGWWFVNYQMKNPVYLAFLFL